MTIEINKKTIYIDNDGIGVSPWLNSNKFYTKKSNNYGRR